MDVSANNNNNGEKAAATADGRREQERSGSSGSNAQPSTIENDMIDSASRTLKRLITWSVWLGTTLMAIVFLLGAGLSMLSSPWLVEIAKRNFAATIGLPFACLAAFAVVTILESTSGPLEFEGLSFKFKGSSGPAVLWLACFIAIATAMKLLWVEPAKAEPAKVGTVTLRNCTSHQTAASATRLAALRAARRVADDRHGVRFTPRGNA
ncbi:hypothetical protein WME90_33045 [Sorangium sp. So ce375]|uniref:hypothetical protein n=1 Tax=Sorangium sp. So ce375 TaxID=3133306 RepID=UPI003F5B2074